MLKPGELDLSDAKVFDEGFPHDYFRMLRAEAPVCWHPEPNGPGHWAVTRYDDVKTASRNPQVFSSWLGGTTIRDMPPEHIERSRAIMLNMDPPQHAKYRRLVQRGFTPRMIQQLTPQIRQRAGEIIDRVAPRGECEFVSEVAAELPMQVICEMMGVPEEDRRTIYDLSNRLIGFDDPQYQRSVEDGIHASIEMFMYASKLSELDFNSFFLLLAVAGNETTRTATSQGIRLLAEHPAQRERVLRDPSLIPAAIEEIVRFNPPVMHFRRTATQDLELRGQQIKEGDKVVFWHASANRDETAFDDPDTFDVRRSPNNHIAFGGGGPHFCLGANLARMEIMVMFDRLLDRMSDMRLDGEVQRLQSNFINGTKHIPVAFEPSAPVGGTPLPARAR